MYLFIKAHHEALRLASPISGLVSLASKKLFLEMQEKIFKTKIKHFYIKCLVELDKDHLKTLLGRLNLTSTLAELYSNTNKLVTIHVYDDTQTIVFINQSKELIIHELIYIKIQTNNSETNPLNNFFSLEIFKDFCDKLKISETKTKRFIYAFQKINNFKN